MNKSKHQPLPWTAQFVSGNRDTENAIYKVIDAQGKSVCEYAWKESADLIVRAVNAHDDLVGALEAIADPTVRADSVLAQIAIDRFRAIARAALAKAKGE